MTRLEEFADRVTREMLRAYWTEPCDDLTLAATNARIVLTREVREFVTGAVNWQDERSAMDPIEEPRAADWLDCPIAAPTPEQREAPACQACGSTRGMPESMRDKGCLNCHGDGPDPATQPMATKPCAECGGAGELVLYPCPTCHGEGRPA